MLFAYAVSGDTTLTASDIRDLSLAIDEIRRAHLPTEMTLGLDAHTLVPGTRVDGVFMRGYQQLVTKGEAMWLVNGLRQLSRQFPAYTIYLSGWGELPMTELRAGEFTMFADTYERAHAEFAAAHSALLRRKAQAH